jgi:UTP--glucose-1-phosphate uridylyltransferase
MKITKAVIPAAGFGTRFLPITKSIPKEMLPLVDRPIIQIVVEELVSAGIKDIIFVVSPHKRAIEDYFNPHFELETLLEKAGKEKELKEVKRLFKLANFVFVRQKKMGGTGDAILTAEPAIGKEPFIVCWGDDFIVAQPSRAKQLIKAFDKYQAPILGCINTEKPEDGGRYGFACGKEIEKGLIKVSELIEKPGIGKAPSKMAVVSGFILTGEIFEHLHKVQKEIGEKREFYYLDGLNNYRKKKPVYALNLEKAKYYDTGNKLEYLKAVVEFGLKDPSFGKEFKEFLASLKS